MAMSFLGDPSVVFLGTTPYVHVCMHLEYVCVSVLNDYMMTRSVCNVNVKE